MKKFLIFAPAFYENSGGAIVLHRLCHLLNEAGYHAELVPMFYSREANMLNIGQVTEMVQRDMQLLLTHAFPTNPRFNTPRYGGNLHALRDNDDYVVVYPEIIFGNPLGCKNVVRWFLHDPGFHTGTVCYSRGELYFPYASFTQPFHLPGSHTAEQPLFVGYFPLELYNLDGVAAERQGTAYLVRKGRTKPIEHDLNGSVLIESQSHEEVAALFKRIKTFISYDSRTLYSELAALCGCDSVVIPDPGVSEEQWRPEPRDRNGLAYGWDRLEHARATRHLVVERLQDLQDKSKASVLAFAREVERFFPDQH